MTERNKHAAEIGEKALELTTGIERISIAELAVLRAESARFHDIMGQYARVLGLAPEARNYADLAYVSKDADGSEVRFSVLIQRTGKLTPTDLNARILEQRERALTCLRDLPPTVAVARAMEILSEDMRAGPEPEGFTGFPRT